MRAWSRRESRRWRVAALLAGLVATLACGAANEDSAPTHAADFAAPPSPRATLVLTPPVLEIGEVTVVELAVVTPPGFLVLPVAPVELPGLWLLGVRSVPPEAHADRVVHRTEFRVRPRDAGTHTWPAMTVRVETQDGAALSLDVEARTFEVASVRDRFAREEPFGLEDVDEEVPWPQRFGVGLAAGLALAALAAFAGSFLRRAIESRRTRAVAKARAAREHPILGLVEWSERELGSVLDALDEDPRAAASTGAHLLRVFMSRRWGGDTEAATTEELERRTPLLAQRASWPDFIRILHHFDEVRFRPNGAAGTAEQRARTRRAVEDALRLVATSRPEPGRRTGR